GKNVILAAPTTLIAMLKAVHYGWKQETIAENALAISKAGQELYERTATLVEHLSRVGVSLGSAVGAFNDVLNSYESRVVPSARRLKELGVAGQKEVDRILKIEKQPRSVGPTSGV
ncbi:MAG TPA: DNA recombination protein RmuC, partial [Planctomycetota bacterium]|nr:DNA recombination protein RmuC [Planctomycetota bacterium]